MSSEKKDTHNVGAEVGGGKEGSVVMSRREFISGSLAALSLLRST